MTIINLLSFPKNCQYNSQDQALDLRGQGRRSQGHKNLASKPSSGLEEFVTGSCHVLSDVV